ncbi:LLM class flavin-dependent oxidoreductase [Agromyces mangrovi Wang et al. 2018]|uniref:LLM class flavin-dependent oxidoreductase n=1 Tax=Agromyces mangrovi TaxID=1858653 RepID=UPI0025734B46|nr:LLM class flavin-dependent oxidoreductase [Agromyces mangrovi]BDZ64229.1 luciferase [Agromyces mangrovi]
MQIGIALDTHGTADRPVRWESLRAQARAAEEAGFDLLVLPDHLYYPADDPVTAWESVSLAGAIAASTSRIRIGHSVVNIPYRAPTIVAAIANTLDEISGGRYVLGLGAGNTPDAEYEALGIDASRRYSRAVEAVTIVTEMLRTGRSDAPGPMYPSAGATLAQRSPRPTGPPVVLAANGPRMLELAARLADEWNGYDHSGSSDGLAAFRPLVAGLDAACDRVGRDPLDLRRTVDVVVGHGASVGLGFDGSTQDIAERILRLGELGITEVRCYIPPRSTAERIAELEPLVAAVHAG